MQPTPQPNSLDFTCAKGLHTDSLPNNQPLHTYPFAQDITLRSDLVRESAMLPELSYELPGEGLGMWPLNNQTVVFYRAPNAAGGMPVGGIGVWSMGPDAATAGRFEVIWESYLLKLAGPVIMRTRLDYRGHRIVYFSDNVNPVRKLDLDGPKPIESDDMDLVLHNPLPDIGSWSVLDGGNLPAGMYQVLARLLTTSKVGTPFNIGTPLIPLSARPSTVPWPQYDGGLERPGSEQLRVNVTGISPGFRYVQLAVVTYDPYTLTPDVRLQDPVEITPTQTEVSLLVSSLPDAQISADQLITEAINIKTAKRLEVAKESLLLYDVTVQKEDGFDWQTVANQVEVNWTMEQLTTVPNKPNIQGKLDTSASAGPLPLYYNTKTAAEMKSLQRREVYSLALSPIIEGERTQAAFHIPAGVSRNPNATIVWESQELYPVNRGFPVDSAGNVLHIRHHQMPDFKQAPLTGTTNPSFSFDNNTSYVNVLGLEVRLPNNLYDLVPASIRKRLKGFRVLRQHRPVDQSRIIASGLAQPMVNYVNTLFPSPFSGYYPSKDGLPFDLAKNRLAFYSLDTLMGGVDVALAQRVEFNMYLNGRVSYVDSKRENDDDDYQGKKYVDTFVSLTQTDGASVTPQSFLLDQSLTQTVGAGDEFASDISLGDTLGSYSIRNQNGYVLLALDSSGGRTEFTTTGLKKETTYENRDNGTDEVVFYNGQGQGINQDDIRNQIIPATRHLVQLTRDLPSQYGRLEQASYIEIGKLEATAAATQRVFRGDVFIQPCAILLATQQRLKNEDTNKADENGPQFRQLVWFYCESRVNAGRRHFDAPRNNNQGTLPYYPFQKVLVNDSGTGLLQLPVTGGHAVGYNKVYSLEDQLTTFMPRLLSNDAIVDTFHNRTYFSAPLVEGALSDNWQQFRANDYYDLPATHGYLTDIFVQNGILFQRTQQTLYRAYFKETTFASTTSGQAMLGTGLAFAQPSTEVEKADDGFGGGYPAGSSDNPAGRVLVDIERQQVFVFNGQFQELLRPNNCLSAFRRLIATGAITAGAYDPNPLARMVYLFTPSYALSYSLAGQQFVGFHLFGAHYACTTGRHVLLLQGSQLKNLTYGLPSTRSALDLVGLPIDGKREGVFFAGQYHGMPLPSSVTMQTPTQGPVQRTFRLHKGLQDTERDDTQMVARLFDIHYNFEMPFATITPVGKTRLTGSYIQLKLRWNAPMQLRQIQLFFKPSAA
jgi:hypothetical protein